MGLGLPGDVCIYIHNDRPYLVESRQERSSPAVTLEQNGSPESDIRNTNHRHSSKIVARKPFSGRNLGGPMAAADSCPVELIHRETG